MKRRGALREGSRERRSLQTSDRSHCYFMSTWCIRCYQWRSYVKIQLVRKKKKGDKKSHVKPPNPTWTLTMWNETEISDGTLQLYTLKNEKKKKNSFNPRKTPFNCSPKTRTGFALFTLWTDRPPPVTLSRKSIWDMKIKMCPDESLSLARLPSLLLSLFEHLKSSNILSQAHSSLLLCTPSQSTR